MGWPDREKILAPLLIIGTSLFIYDFGESYAYDS